MKEVVWVVEGRKMGGEVGEGVREGRRREGVVVEGEVDMIEG